MHAMGGIHSALAIKRQRKRRNDQKKARERRCSSQSIESGFSPRTSMGSLDKRGRRFRGGGGSTDNVSSRVVTSIGMLHIGVVFLVLGLFLVGSGLLPKDFSSWASGTTSSTKGKDAGPESWFNELVCTGSFALAIGIFLIILNKVISKREEDDLNEYVQTQLTRSKSGHRLERDVETGCMKTKHDRRIKEEPVDEAFENEYPVPVHSPKAFINGDANPHLEKILEEEASEKGEEESRAMDYYNKEVISNDSTTASLSPGTPSETHELLASSGRTYKLTKI